MPQVSTVFSIDSNCLYKYDALQDVVISAVGPIVGLPDYNWFRRRTYWLRY